MTRWPLLVDKITSPAPVPGLNATNTSLSTEELGDNKIPITNIMQAAVINIIESKRYLFCISTFRFCINLSQALLGSVLEEASSRIKALRQSLNK